MLLPELQLRIWLYLRPTDLRKSFDGLSALVRSELSENPIGGQLFVFINRRSTQMKVLYFDGSGYCVWAKRLDRGTFHVGARQSQESKRLITWTDLKLILEGIDLKSVRRFKRFVLPPPRGRMLE